MRHVIRKTHQEPSGPKGPLAGSAGPGSAKQKTKKISSISQITAIAEDQQLTDPLIKETTQGFSMRHIVGKTREPSGPKGPLAGSIKQKKRKVSAIPQVMTTVDNRQLADHFIEETIQSMTIATGSTSSHGEAENNRVIEFEVNNDNLSSHLEPINWVSRSYRPRREEARHADRVARTGIDSSEKIATRKGRGPNKPDNMKPKPSESKWKVYFSHDYRILGLKSKKFADFIGDQARNHHHFPIYKRWSREHDKKLLRVFKEAEQHYEFIAPINPDPEAMGRRKPLDRMAVLTTFKESFQRKLCEWRHRVKKEFYDLWIKANSENRKIIETKLSDTFRIPKQEWPAVCEYFGSDRFQKDSQRNTANRNSAVDKPTGTMGSISHARACEVLKDNLGDDYNDMVGFDYCHTINDALTKKRVYPDEGTSRFMENLHLKAQERGFIPSKEPGASNLAPFIDDVSGKNGRGYARGLGIGPSKTFLKDSHIRAQLDAVEEERKEWEREREDYKKKIVDLEAKNDELTEQTTRPVITHATPRAPSNPVITSGLASQAMLNLLLSGVAQDPNMQFSTGNVGTSIGETLATMLTDAGYFGAQNQRNGHEEANIERGDDGSI